VRDRNRDADGRDDLGGVDLARDVEPFVAAARRPRSIAFLLYVLQLVVRAIGAAVEGYARHRRRVATIRTLGELSDHTLRDIGIQRASIPDVQVVWGRSEHRAALQLGSVPVAASDAADDPMRCKFRTGPECWRARRDSSARPSDS
jgi:uncharacterized protein YjiS (DUF1127 family)